MSNISPTEAVPAQTSQKPTETALRETRIKKFVARLVFCERNQLRGELAALRYSLGGDTQRAYQYVMPHLGSYSDDTDKYFYLIGALFAWHPRHVANQSFARAFRKLKEEGATESTVVRFMALLACNERELDSHLRQCVGILRAHEIGLDYAALLRDLCRGQGWKHPRRWLQEQWAREFYGKQRERNAEPNDAKPAS